MRMGERESYEVLRLIEHNQKCYISSDYVEGKSLIQWLKYHPNLTKKQLFLWIRDLADQLECIHKCRGNPCYQYVNPYSVIVTEDMTLHFLDMSVESNEKMLVQMNRRSVRENFLPPEVNYYQAASIELDIYGLGRTIQYLLSVTDPIPELTRRETVKFQKIISRCLDGHSKRAFKQMSEIQKEIPNVTEKKSKDRRIWTKKRTVMAMISICVFVAAVSVRVIQKKGDEKNTELKMESSDGLNMSEVSEREAFVEAQRTMGLLYFLELEDYEKSIQAFEDAREDQMSENLAVLVRYVAGIEDKESSNEKKEYANEKKIENIFRKIGFLGFGNMAQAMAGGFVRSGAVQPGDIGACARDRAKLRSNTEPQGFRAFDDAAAVAEFADLVVVAVKPYQVEAVLAPVRELLAKKIVVSVAAGVTFDDCERMLAPGTHHLSIVPNTPVSVCEGIVVCERRHSLSDGEWRQVEALFSKIGLVLPMDTALLGISSAVCGCGPAFVAMFIEALGDAAVKHGVARADAYRMASQMIVGTGKLQLASGQHPGAMKDAVCSPGGTTIAGVAELERKGFRGAVIDAIDAIQNKK